MSGQAPTAEPPGRRPEQDRPRWLGRWRHVRLRPAVWSALGAALFVVGALLHWPALWLGILLAVPVMVTSIGLGWRVAWPLVPAGVALAWLAGRGSATHTGVLPLTGLGAALALATAAGNDLFSLWRATARSARANERRARLLGEAALAMHQAHDAAALYRAMPRLLADILDYAHAEVFVPVGDALRLQAAHGGDLPVDLNIPLASVMGRALRSGEAQYVPDVSADSAYVGDPRLPTSKSELALPLLVAGQAHAVLNVEHTSPRAFDAADRRTLEAFARIAGEALARSEALASLERQREEQALVARLEQRLLLAEGAREATAAALSETVPALGLDAGAVAVLRSGALHALAVQGPAPEALGRALNDGLPLEGRLREAWESRRAALIDDVLAADQAGDLSFVAGARAVAIVPITNAQRELRALLLLCDQRGPRLWSERDARVLDIIATSLGVVLDRATLNRQLVALLDVVGGLARAEEPGELYRRAAASAVRLIPGAEAATILVRGDDGFRFEAAVGYELAALRALGPFDDTDELTWYHEGADGYHRGIPRVARGGDVLALSAAAGGERSTSRARAARVSEIVANVCVPITDGGEVVAVLNVDSFSHVGAFGISEQRLTEAFAQQVAVIKRQAEALGQLRRSVITDPLTGLGNRAGFQRRLELELERARRYGHPLNVVMLDLDNFKEVNDRLGHPAGDGVLAQVARALGHAQRSGDAAFRWGGDEFVMLLPEVDADAARSAAERYQEAVASVEVEGIRLKASVGLARFPEDGDDHDTLMKRADDRMYHRKQAQPREDASAGYASSPSAGGSSSDSGGGGTVA